MDQSGPASYHRFFRDVGSRLSAEWPLKMVGLSFGMSAFFVIYFALLHHPVFPVTIMPRTAIDRWINFRPETLPLYFSLWVYVPLAFTLLKTRHELRVRGMMAATISVVGFTAFFLYPTAVPLLSTQGDMPSAFSFLKTIDASGNACPSFHVAFAFFSAVTLDQILRELRSRVVVRLANWIWCTAIVYSTLSTGQHVALDVAAGILLGAAMFLPKLIGITFPRAFSRYEVDKRADS